MAENAINSMGLRYVWDKILAKLSSKVDKVNGKVLSSNDFTTEEKNKLAGLDGSTYMVKGVDYVTAGKASSVTLGEKATSEGMTTRATGDYSHAEGLSSTASGSQSHSEGSATTASGSAAHAEGMNTEASYNGSHAEGGDTHAAAAYAHTEGQGTTASKTAAHAEGQYTRAGSYFQHVQGKYNVEDAENVYAHIVGGGTSNSDRKNIHTLDWEGNAFYAGDVETASFSIVNGALNITYER